MNRDLFLAILSMDSYNRGYGVSIKALSESGQLGNATLLAATTEQQAGWETAGFYAIAYDVSQVAGFDDQERVVAYRGSDNFLGADSFSTFLSRLISGQNPLGGNDIFNGYGVALGHPDGPQALLALEFYSGITVTVLTVTEYN